MDEREQTLSAEIKRWHSETVSAFSERREQLEAIRKDAEGAFKEHKDSVAANAASFRSDLNSLRPHTLIMVYVGQDMWDDIKIMGHLVGTFVSM